jgi:hypothetical protein
MVATLREDTPMNNKFTRWKLYYLKWNKKEIFERSCFILFSYIFLLLLFHLQYVTCYLPLSLYIHNCSLTHILV